MGWGESWEKKVSLATKLGVARSDELEKEKSAIRVLHGVVANQEGIEAGVLTLYPSLAKIDVGQSFSSSVETFINTCHAPDSGKFCGQAGPNYPLKNVLNDVWSNPKFHANPTTNMPPVSGDDGPRIVTPNQPLLDRAEKEKTQIRTNRARNEKNSWGFSENDLDKEKQDITRLIKRGGHTVMRLTGTAFEDRVDAETRAKAVLEGRVAQKSEIKFGRSKARSRNWGALIALGIIAK